MVLGIDGIRSEIERLIRGTSADISVLWSELGAEQPIFEWESDKRMPSASVIKVAIMLAILEQSPDLAQMIPVRTSDILGDTRVFESGKCETSLHELLYWMITQSDNTATNVLIRRYGYDLINDFCKRRGLTNTHIARVMLDFDALRDGRDNVTCAMDMHTLFAWLFYKCRNETAIALLLRQRDTRLFKRYIWEDDVRIYHKSGGLDYLSHDVGVFEMNTADGIRRWFLSVMVQHAADIHGEPRLIGRIAREVLDYYRGNV